VEELKSFEIKVGDIIFSKLMPSIIFYVIRTYDNQNVIDNNVIRTYNPITNQRTNYFLKLFRDRIEAGEWKQL
jgi:hypothetical protein